MTARVKLLLLGGDGGPSGVPRYLGQVAEALRDLAEIVVVSEADRGGFGFVQDLGLRHRIIDGLASSLNPIAFARAEKALGQVLADERPAVVWANARLTLPMARWCLGRKPNGPALICTYHGIPFGHGRSRPMSALQWAVEAGSLTRGPGEWQVFLTEADRSALGKLASRARVISNSSGLGGFLPRSESSGAEDDQRIRLVMLTRNAPQKDLAAAARLMAMLPEVVTLTLYGTGTDSAPIRQKFARILSAAQLARVNFGGPLADVRPALAAADGFLVTSRYEGQSLAMLEAMEYGLPVFSTRVGGAAEMAAEHPMMALISLDDDAGVAQAAQTIVAICAAWQASQAAASSQIHQAWARTYSQDRFARDIRRLWQDVLAECNEAGSL